jgi:hypothetical protein
MLRRSPIKAGLVAAPQPPEEGLSVGYLMGRARASLLSGLDTELERFGLSGMQFAVLKHLADGAARTAADLCRFMQYDTGAMTRILDRLEARAWCDASAAVRTVARWCYAWHRAAAHSCRVLPRPPPGSSTRTSPDSAVQKSRR